MVTMMEHPQHGRHPATGSEVEALKANGWAVMAPKQRQEEKAVEVQQESEQPRQKRKYTKRAA